MLSSWLNIASIWDWLFHSKEGSPEAEAPAKTVKKARVEKPFVPSGESIIDGKCNLLGTIYV